MTIYNRLVSTFMFLSSLKIYDHSLKIYEILHYNNVIFRIFLALAQAYPSLTLILILKISGRLFHTYSG